MNSNPDKKNKKKDSLNRKAFKHAIGMLESSGGKNLSNPTSSAAGKYHFLYNLIKKDPDMKGISKRQFIGDPELQEKIMDKALDGKIEGFPYGEGYANKIIKDYNLDKNVNEVTALVHFLGPTDARKYLKNPNAYEVPGKNMEVDKYLKNFNNYFEDFQPEEKTLENPKPLSYSSPTGSLKPARERVIESTAVAKPQMKKIPDINQFLEGGQMTGKLSDQITGDASDLVTLFENGGSHEQNSLGGIPQGIGANGKPNLVEEGETKWNDYVFSNEIDLDGNCDISGSKINVFKEGGPMLIETDPLTTNPLTGDKGKKSTTIKEDTRIEGPVVSEGDKYPMTFTKTSSRHSKKGLDMSVDDIRKNYTSNSNPLITSEDDEVNFSLATQDPGAKKFLERYNDPITRSRMKEQTGLTDYDIDNMILKGLTTEKKIEPNRYGAKAVYSHDDNLITMSPDHKNNTDAETHERIHSSGFDAAQGINLLNVLGSAWQQETRSGLKSRSPETVRYLSQPHEAYGNFAEFREKIGMKPGEKIDVIELKKRVKESGANMENFYRAFDDENIVKALNTIAYEDNNINKSEYKLS